MKSERPAWAVNVRVMRAKLGLSQAELAKKSGVSKPAVSNIERGRNAPSLQVMTKLADVLGCSLDELAGRK